MCPPLIPPRKGSLHEHHPRYGDITEARCNTGHRFFNNTEKIVLECMEHGQWNVTLEDGKIPDCQRNYARQEMKKNIKSHNNTRGYIIIFFF